MHILQSEHTKLSEKDAEELLKKLNVSKAQLPKIFITDSALPEGCQIGDIIKIVHKGGDKTSFYFRVIV
ncbi:DNA-directed RNA polymerase subunit H [Candidatus Pacearchaeota archaeon]|nr:DNA-directed RNA polymerase subunit H [Candidatus Pacearchaeota archaeon]